jgi:hypothetical protein
VFALVLICAQLRQGIITLLVAPIKRDLHLTDSQFSTPIIWFGLKAYSHRGTELRLAEA